MYCMTFVPEVLCFEDVLCKLGGCDPDEVDQQQDQEPEEKALRPHNRTRLLPAILGHCNHLRENRMSIRMCELYVKKTLTSFL